MGCWNQVGLLTLHRLPGSPPEGQDAPSTAHLHCPGTSTTPSAQPRHRNAQKPVCPLQWSWGPHCSPSVQPTSGPENSPGKLVIGDKKGTVSTHGPTGDAVSQLPHPQGYSQASELPTGMEDPRQWPRPWRGSHVSNVRMTSVPNTCVAQWPAAVGTNHSMLIVCTGRDTYYGLDYSVKKTRGAGPYW